MNRLLALAGLCAVLLSGCAATPKSESYFYPDQVRDSELAFARTMAARDHAAFGRFIAEDAIFFDGDRAIRGKARIVESWKPYFSEPQAPFSWGPSVVQVLDSGNLALTSGPVFDPAGKLIGRFNSIWRQEAPGVWRVVFDKGSEVCNCEPRITTQAAPVAAPLQMAQPVPIAPEPPAGSEELEQPLPVVTGH